MMKLIKCPVCRARLQEDEDFSPVCQRCNSDLTLLKAAYETAKQLQHQARLALRAGQTHDAVRSARRAVYLVDEPETRATLAAVLYQQRRDTRRHRLE